MSGVEHLGNAHWFPDTAKSRFTVGCDGFEVVGMRCFSFALTECHLSDYFEMALQFMPYCKSLGVAIAL